MSKRVKIVTALVLIVLLSLACGTSKVKLPSDFRYEILVDGWYYYCDHYQFTEDKSCLKAWDCYGKDVTIYNPLNVQILDRDEE